MAKILLVEDEPFLLEMLTNVVEARGHTAVAASNGVEGLKKFTDGVDLTITDIVMPDMEGIGMIQALRRQDPTAKIIAMSGGGTNGSLDFLKFARAFGAMAAFKKPFELDEFWHVVDKCLDETPAIGN